MTLGEKDSLLPLPPLIIPARITLWSPLKGHPLPYEAKLFSRQILDFFKDMERPYKRNRTYGYGFRGARASGSMLVRPAFSGARGGVEVRVSGARYNRRRTYGRTGYTRRAGFYGRFGTGRGNRAQIERKFLDTAYNFTADQTLENVGSAVLIPQGATQSQRIGYKCVIKSIQWRGVVTLPPGASGNDDVYIFLVQDTQTNGAAAATTDVWTGTGAATMLRNIQNGDRFKVLAKICLSLNANAGVAAAFDGDQKVFEGFLKCNIPLNFNGATGVITELKSNNLTFFAGSVSTDDVMTVAFQARVRYTDQ